MSDERKRKYVEAIGQHTLSAGLAHLIADSVMTVADAEQAELRSSREALIDHNRELIAERRALLDKVARVEALAVDIKRDGWCDPDSIYTALREALDRPGDPADVQPDEADIAHRASMHD